MTRVASALVLLAMVVGITWWLPPIATLILAEIVVLCAVGEYVHLVARLGTPVPMIVVATAALATCAAVGRGAAVTEVVLMAATIVIGALVVSRPAPAEGAHRQAAVAMFAPLYVGLPLGALVALRTARGPEVVLLLLATIVASDTAQYYGGRACGRRLLAPATSPRKTVEGAVFGVVAGVLVMWIVGYWWLSPAAPWLRGCLGAALVGAGIVGDLFESRLKREADVKDTSGLIPGHGGVLDRLDSLLFAAPLYFIALRAI